MEKLLSIQEAADLLGLKKPTLYKKVMCRTIPFIKLGGRVLFKESMLDEWVNNHAIDTLN